MLSYTFCCYSYVFFNNFIFFLLFRFSLFLFNFFFSLSYTIHTHTHTSSSHLSVLNYLLYNHALDYGDDPFPLAFPHINMYTL